MSQAVPIIFTPPTHRQVVGPSGRMLALGIALATLAVLVTAVIIKPSAAGVGTHLQMGFHRCDFLLTTNLPCPTCGMTTSFSWFVRGNWLASVYVQPMGFLLAFACGVTFWGAMFVTLTGSPIHRLLAQLPGLYYVGLTMAFFIAGWGWKIFIHVRGIDGWQ